MIIIMKIIMKIVMKIIMILKIHDKLAGVPDVTKEKIIVHN